MDERNLSNFEKAGEHGPIEKFEKSVTTPSSVEEMGGEKTRFSNGYAQEDNRVTAYVLRGPDLLVKVSKVATLGWSVSRFRLDGTIEDVGGPYFDTEESAHGAAKEAIEEEMSP